MQGNEKYVKSLERKGFCLRAEVAELADAADSKSAGPRAREGSTPSLGTKIRNFSSFLSPPFLLDFNGYRRVLGKYTVKTD